MDFAARDDGNPLVQQFDEGAQDAALRLTAQAEQNEIVSGEDGVDELRNDRLVEADDAGEESFARAQLAYQVVADLLLDRPGSETRAASNLDRSAAVYVLPPGAAKAYAAKIAKTGTNRFMG